MYKVGQILTFQEFFMTPSRLSKPCADGFAAAPSPCSLSGYLRISLHQNYFVKPGAESNSVNHSWQWDRKRV